MGGRKGVHGSVIIGPLKLVVKVVFLGRLGVKDGFICLNFVFEVFIIILECEYRILPEYIKLNSCKLGQNL